MRAGSLATDASSPQRHCAALLGSANPQPDQIALDPHNRAVLVCFVVSWPPFAPVAQFRRATRVFVLSFRLIAQSHVPCRPSRAIGVFWVLSEFRPPERNVHVKMF